MFELGNLESQKAHQNGQGPKDMGGGGWGDGGDPKSCSAHGQTHTVKTIHCKRLIMIDAHAPMFFSTGLHNHSVRICTCCGMWLSERGSGSGRAGCARRGRETVQLVEGRQRRRLAEQNGGGGWRRGWARAVPAARLLQLHRKRTDIANNTG